YALGFNCYYATSMPGGYACGDNLSDAQLDTLMADMAAAGATTVRVWWVQSYGFPNWTQYDRVLHFADAHGIRVVATLVNHWTACQGGASTLKTPSWYQSGYKG